MKEQEKNEEFNTNYYNADKAHSTLEFYNNLDVFSKPREYCCTHIVCTIGPACNQPETLEAMITNGMNIARLNFSHGDHAFHAKQIKLIRDASKMCYPSSIAIALDTKGPEIRTGLTRNNETITLVTDRKIILTTDDEFKENSTAEMLYLDYKSLPKSCKVGQKILVADGSAVLEVKRITMEGHVECRILCGATFGSRKNVCIPGIAVDLPALAPKDIEDIKFAAIMELDMIFASFIRNADNVSSIRKILSEFPNGKDIKIISKIENFEGVKNIDEIIEASDGIMVARGDLGMDLPVSKVIAAQKMIISKCNFNCKPVICATQMMESMIINRRPTRAEVSDVGNAVLDGADCVMLSGETANGKYPTIAVKKMRKVCRESEDIVFYRQVYENIKNSKPEMDCSLAISMAASSISYKINAGAIIVLSTSGNTAALISHFRPRCPIIVVTRSSKVGRALNLYRNVFSVLYERAANSLWEQDVNDRLNFGITLALKMGLVQTDSDIVFVCGWQSGPGFSNTVRVLKIGGDHTIKGMSKSHSQQRLL